MSRLAKGIAALELLPLAELLEIHERIEHLIDEKSENERLKIGRVHRRWNCSVGLCELSKEGRPVAPKYRDPFSGATWSGRGREPRWMAHLIRQGAKREDFRIRKVH